MTYHATIPGHDPSDLFAGIAGRDMAGAACVGHDPELWFDGDNDEGKEICSRCPLRPDCLQWGLDGEEWGVWGEVGTGRHRLKFRGADCHPDEPHYGLGMCRPCYAKAKINKPVSVCVDCDDEKPIYGLGRCGACYMRIYRTQAVATA